jgi:hypothetical protein
MKISHIHDVFNNNIHILVEYNTHLLLAPLLSALRTATSAASCTLIKYIFLNIRRDDVYHTIMRINNNNNNNNNTISAHYTIIRIICTACVLHHIPVRDYIPTRPIQFFTGRISE